MFVLRDPSPTRIHSFRESQAAAGFSYPEVGATRGRPPAGYTVDEYQVRLGTGESVFGRAILALRGWRHFDLGWLRLVADGPPREGQVVAVVARHALAFSLHACRVVYTLEKETEDRRLFAFAYGTLQTHAESGEERFEVCWDRHNGTVTYRILAFSRPNHWLVRLGQPLARRLQRRFARESQAAMLRAVNATAAG